MILTWAEYCVYAGLDPVQDADEQTLVTNLINAAQLSVENLLCRNLEVASRTLETTWKSNICLQAYPVTLLQIFVDPLGTFLPATDVTSSIYLDKKSGIVVFPNSAYSNMTPVKIIWTGGIATIPEDLKLAIYKIVNWNLKRIKSIGIKSTTTGEATSTYESTIPADVRQMLDSYAGTK